MISLTSDSAARTRKTLNAYEQRLEWGLPGCAGEKGQILQGCWVKNIKLQMDRKKFESQFTPWWLQLVAMYLCLRRAQVANFKCSHN